MRQCKGKFIVIGINIIITVSVSVVSNNRIQGVKMSAVRSGGLHGEITKFSSHRALAGFSIPLQLLHWRNFEVILGSQTQSWVSLDSFWRAIQALEILHEAEIFVTNIDVVAKNLPLAFSASSKLCFLTPSEFQEKLSVSNSSSLFTWLLMTDKDKIPEWVKLLNRDISLDSDIYLSYFDADSGTFQVLEIYRICDTCLVETIEFCSLHVSMGRVSFSHGACFKDKYQRRQDLQGFPVRAIALNVNPFDVTVVKRNDSSWEVQGGMWVEIFEMLAAECNFTMSVQVLDGYKFGKFDPVTNTWNGIMGAVSTGQVDVSLNPLSIAIDRVAYVDYGLSVHSVGIRIYIRSTSESKWINWSFFINPFTPALHAAILLLTATFAVVLQLFLNARPKQDKRFSFYETSWIVLAAVFQKGSHMIPTSPSAKAIFMSAYLTCLTIFCAYSATLISQLSVPQPMKLPFTDLKGLVKSSGWKGGPIRGDFTNIVMEQTCPRILATSDNSSQNSQCELLTNAWTKVVAPIQSTLPKDFAEGLQKVLKERFAFMATVTGARFLLNSETMTEQEACGIVEFDQDTLSSNLAIPMRKLFPFRKLFSYQLLQVFQSGILSRIKRKWLPMRKNCRFQGTDFTQVSLSDVAVAPLLVVIGIGTSLVVMGLEVMWRRSLP